MNGRALRMVHGLSMLTTLVVALAFTSRSQAMPFADYRDDFSGASFPTGWQYQWNSGGAFGNPANYTNLLSAGSSYNFDGGSPLPRANPAAFLNLNGTGGHPGRGSGQGATFDRYPIAAYTLQIGDVPAGGAPVYLTGTLLNVGSGSSNGVEAAVHVNGNPIAISKIAPGGNIPQGFNGFLGNLNVGDTVYVGLGPNVTDGSDSFSVDFSLEALNVPPLTPLPAVIADYHDDYRNNVPSAGWQYMWNRTGAIGNPNNYFPLRPTGSAYDIEGTPGLPGAAPGSFDFLDATGGHPGQGSSQASDGIARYAIAAFTVPRDGFYALTDTSFSTLGNGDNLLLVHVNSDPAVFSQLVPAGGTTTFDFRVGELKGGDTIYVAVGPGDFDSFDNFAIDFSITQVPVPEPASGAMMMLGLLALSRLRRRRERVIRL